MTFPIYIGAMIAAALFRNIGEYSGKFTIHMGEINDLGGISLSLFLGIAMITLKLWQLASLALPLFILLAVQVLLICCFTYFLLFNIMGRDYDAAVLVAGTCGLVWVQHQMQWPICRRSAKIHHFGKSLSADSARRQFICRFY